MEETKGIWTKYLKNESVQKESNCWEEQCKQGNNGEVFEERVGFLLPIDDKDLFEETHFDFEDFPTKAASREKKEDFDRPNRDHQDIGNCFFLESG